LVAGREKATSEERKSQRVKIREKKALIKDNP